MHIVSAQALNSWVDNEWIAVGIRDLIRREGVMLRSADDPDRAAQPIGVWDEASLSHRQAGQLWVLITTVCPHDMYVGSIRAIAQQDVSNFSVGDHIQFHEDFIDVVIIRN